MDKIKFCPFCGNVDQNEFDFPGTVGAYNVHCCICHTWGPTAETNEESINAWNNRVKGAPDPEKPGKEQA